MERFGFSRDKMRDVNAAVRGGQQGADMSEPSGHIRQERDGSIGMIVLARPERRNALKSEMYGQIADALTSFQSDDGVHVIVIRGEGRDFCAGNDIGDFKRFGEVIEATGADPQSFMDRRRTPSINLVHVLTEIDKPLVACIQGNAVGFGATILLHCDVVIAESDAKLRFPFVDLALVPEAGSTMLLKERVGYLKAAEIFLNAGILTATEGAQLGLISEVAPEGRSLQRAIEVASKLADKPPLAMRATKRLLRRDAEPLSDRVAEEFRETAERTNSSEARAIFARMLKK